MAKAKSLNEHQIMKIFEWNNFPVLHSCCKTPPSDDIFYDFFIQIDTDTGLVHQKNIPPQDIVYALPRNSAVGKVWLEHHDEFFKFISRIDLKDKKICEIGSGSGYLAKQIGRHYQIDCYEPNPFFEENQNIKIHKRFFYGDPNKKYDIILLSHVLEHVPNLDDFLNDLRQSLTDQGKIFLSFPNLTASIESEHFTIFNSEHVSYFTLTSSEKVLNKNGFQNCVFDTYKDHSIFIQAEKTNDFRFTRSTEVENCKIKDYVNNYLKNINDKISLIEKKLSQIDKFYLFGCHIMTGLLLYLSKKMDQNKIISILDNDHLKHDLRLYGTNHFCTPVLNANPDHIVLNGGCYHNEIKKQLIDNKFKVIEWD